jgi:hypothetical protein
MVACATTVEFYWAARSGTSSPAEGLISLNNDFAIFNNHENKQDWLSEPIIINDGTYKVKGVSYDLSPGHYRWDGKANNGVPLAGYFQVENSSEEPQRFF